MTALDRRRDPAPRGHGDEGAVLVEAVFMLPIMLTLLCGLIDYGIGMRDRQVLQGSARNAARVAAASSTFNTGKDADRFGMTTLWAGIQSVQNVALQRTVVFKANPTTWVDQTSAPLSSPPAICLTTPTNDAGAGVNAGGVSCNIYSPNQVKNAATAWTSGVIVPALPLLPTTCSTSVGYDRYWCPVSRSALLSDNAGKGTDYLGVYVRVVYTPMTGLFAGTITMDDTIIVRLEPKG
jgi:Flp pilus assembly protein TadG